MRLTFVLYLSVLTPNGSNASDKVLTICSIIERGSRVLLADYDRLGASLDLAITTANTEILPDGVTFTLVYKDGGRICAPKSSTIGRIVEWIQENVTCHIYIGPGCSEAVLDLYQVAEHNNIPLIGIPGAHTSSRSGLPRSTFKNLIRTTYTFVDLGKAVKTFMDNFNYTHNTIIINTDSYFYAEMGDNFRNQFRNQHQDERKKTTFVEFAHDQMPAKWTVQDFYGQLLRDANETSRVILLFANASVVRNIMVTAYSLGMANGEHVRKSLAIDISPRCSDLIVCMGLHLRRAVQEPNLG
ncbi:hypothetical protein RvY_13387-2 [Ramazzottius varieornatus]|nr:hypothetical protein RvY_13387-2 [Ramazzottius varieornatus]